ncbi:MAG: rane protein [Frankiales bacterium]|nr:rane protein [Frankiales bacterium]
MNPEPGSGLVVLYAVAAGLVGGVLTSYAQGWLPSQVGSLANSAGPWCLIAFLAALPARRPALAAFCGAVTLVALVSGYYAASMWRGYGVSTRTVDLWVFAAFVAGPVLGLSAHWLRDRRAPRAAMGAAVPATLLLAEAAYGIRVIADTTYPAYWWAEAGCGAALLVVGAYRFVSSERHPDRRS